MATATLQLDSRQVVAAMTKLRTQMPRILARALNKSATSARTAMVTAVREDAGLKAGTVRSSIEMEKARPGSNPTAKLKMSQKRIPLIEFNARQLKRAGVKANLKGGAKTYPGAFIATMPGGHRGVYKRAGAARLPLKAELKGPSIAKVFVKKWRVGVLRFREQLPKNIKAEINFASSR